MSIFGFFSTKKTSEPDDWDKLWIVDGIDVDLSTIDIDDDVDLSSSGNDMIEFDTDDEIDMSSSGDDTIDERLFFDLDESPETASKDGPDAPPRDAFVFVPDDDDTEVSTDPTVDEPDATLFALDSLLPPGAESSVTGTEGLQQVAAIGDTDAGEPAFPDLDFLL